MATLSVLTFDPEGRPIEFESWLDDLQLFLLSDSKDGILLFDLTSGASPAPPDTAGSTTHSQWLTRDATARLAVGNHLPLAERAPFGQHKTAKALYDAVVAGYSSPATAALGRLLLPYLFPKLSAFATVADLVTHRRTSDVCYRAALPAEDLLLALDPTYLTVDLLKKHLLAAETSLLTTFVLRRWELRLPLVGGAAAARAGEAGAVGVAEVEAVVGAVEAVEGAAVAERLVVGVEVQVAAVVAAVRVVAAVQTVAAAVVAVVGVEAAAVVAAGVVPARGEALVVVRGNTVGRQSQTLSPQELREWFAQRGAAGGSGPCPYVIRTGDRSGQKCGKLDTQYRCFSRLTDAFRAEFPDAADLPRWAKLLRQGMGIFVFDYDAIFFAMYALTVSVEGDCYLSMPPDPDIEVAAPGASEAAALGAGESALSGTASAAALHTFTLDLGASRCFFRDCTTVTPLSAPVAVSLADP
ncbi:unnamed protein product [Closterium sp. NIES-65]|nr:unnamed protein product [Closterium sp. NIES-65]